MALSGKYNGERHERELWRCTEWTEGHHYYQPVVEDFEINYYVGEWCRLYGFEIVACEVSGEDEGYEHGKRFW